MHLIFQRPLSTNNRKETEIRIEKIFCSFFQYIKNCNDIKSRENGGNTLSLLSLIPPSCMVALKRELVNIDIPRGRSNFLSSNNSRMSLTHSNVFSILYADRIEIQNYCPIWAEQVDSLQDYQLSYTISNKKDIYNQDKAVGLNNSPQSYSEMIIIIT